MIKVTCVECGRKVNRSNCQLAYPNNPEVDEYLCEDCYYEMMNKEHPEYDFEEF